MSIQGPPGVQGPNAAGGQRGRKGIVIAGLGLNSVDIHSNQFVQHRAVTIRRRVIIIEQPIYVFQKITRWPNDGVRSQLHTPDAANSSF